MTAGYTGPLEVGSISLDSVEIAGFVGHTRVLAGKLVLSEHQKRGQGDEQLEHVDSFRQRFYQLLLLSGAASVVHVVLSILLWQVAEDKEDVSQTG